MALASELSLDTLLQRLADTAAKITDARYAALGVIDKGGTGLERFVVSGMSPEEQAAVGDPPRGLGILGHLIQDPRPLRLVDIGAHPLSVGFPPNHPPMHTFVGVPIILRGVAFGNLYLTEKRGGGAFTTEDVELVSLLAAQAAVAIDNARLYEDATRWSRQLESLDEIGLALLSERTLPGLLDLIAVRLRELTHARLVTIALPDAGGRLRIEAADGERAELMLETTVSRTRSKSARVLERRRSERVDSMADDPEIDRDAVRRMAGRAALFVPLLLRDRAIGVITVVDREGADPQFSDDDLRLTEAFAIRAATAVDLSSRIARDAVRRVVAGQELERTRLARELHDQTGQALTSILLRLGAIDGADDPTGPVAFVRELVVETLRDVRRLAVELRPSALDDFGLVAALERLAVGTSEQGGPTVDLHARLGSERLPPEVETAIYRIVQEALTNVVKHADAHTVSVVVTRSALAATVVIEDDGRGVDSDGPEGGLGLVGMRERVSLLDGELRIESRPSVGTTIVAEVPLQ
jgi:signal transduction histidine kinase